MSTSAFAERLAALRESQELSQYELARRTGLTRQTLSRLEMGDREPSWGTVQLLALALGVDYKELADPALRLPEPAPGRLRGRPRKAAGVAPEPRGDQGGKPSGEKPAKRQRGSSAKRKGKGKE
jgi:transcriptional regulator with XRE-family HTH domain